MYKTSGIIVDKEVLATPSKGRAMYIQPGGKLEPGEIETQAVVRELQEEMGIMVDEADLEKIATTTRKKRASKENN